VPFIRLKNASLADMTIDVGQVMWDKRTHPRTNIIARAEATWVDFAGTPRAAIAMLEETSPIGACVRLKEPIRVGSKVTIKWRREQFSGTVKHVKKEKSDYIVGIHRDAERATGR
jgi:hypothetical protein